MGSTPARAAAQPATIVISGTVITSSGKADAGATVTIHAWPDQAVMHALKPGQKVPWVLIGTGKADASGKYSISAPADKLTPEASYGVVNLEADTTSAVHVFPVALTRNPGDAYLPGADVVVDLTANAPDFPGCGGDGWNFVQSLGKHLGTVGETYVPTSHATQQFTYSQGQSSSIEIGMSASGNAGSFTDAGTYSWSSSLATTWPTYGANRSVWYQTNFLFGEYSCFIPAAAHTWYMDIVNGYAGGAYIKKPTSIPSTPAKFCDLYVAGSKASSNNSAAVTWTKSLGIATGLGFQASVQTGFDSSAQITYKFSANRDLCGWKSDPGGRPQQLVVHA